MIEVNLLPGGKKRGSRRPIFSLRLPSSGGGGFGRDPWVLGSSLVVLAAAVVGGFLFTTTSSRRGELEVRIEEARADSARYADLILQNEALMARRDSIAQRVEIIQEIDGDRYVWPHIMDEVARALPEYTWLTDLLQLSLGEELEFRIEGRAGNTFALTQFMENLEASLFIRSVDLVTTEQVIDDSDEGTRRVVYHFQLEALFERPPPELLETVPLFDASSAGR
ncbi:MAG: PilN domain-containing protein [Gemmatimonadota bacterium]